MGQLMILRRTLSGQPKVSLQYCSLHQRCLISVGMNMALTVLLSFCVGLSMLLYSVCADILPRQYLNFSDFVHLGIVDKWYINQGISITLQYQ